MSWDIWHTLSARTLLILGIVAATFGQHTLTADEETKQPANGNPLVVRDVAVYLLSAYGTQLNERGLFSSTLPSYTLSRRPSADRNSSKEATPAGIITFSGPAEKDVDVLLEFDNGRFLSHWPPGRLRSKRLLWAGIDSSGSPAKEPTSMPDGHWLLPLRDSNRLYLDGNKQSDRFLLYDVELPYAPHVTLERAAGGYTITNTGKFPIHDVVIYRPTESKHWEVATIAEVGAASKQEENDEVEQPASSPAPEKSASPQEAQPQPAAAAPVAVPVAVEAVAADGEAAVASDATAAPQEGDPAEAEDKPPEQKKPVAGTSAPASTVGVLAAEDIVNSWRQSLVELQLEQPEIDFVLGILQQYALSSDSAMLVYRLNEAQLEKLLPIEVTPYPDRLFRVALVIVQDADPDMQSQIDSLVARLGHDEWRQREEAHKELAGLGLAAKPKLEAALKHKDTEIVFRAEQLLEAIKAKQ